MKGMKRFFRLAATGYVLGMAVGNMIAALTGHLNIVSPELLQKAGSLSAALLWQTLLSGLIGAAGFGGTLLYKLDRWPLAACDAVHLALVLAVFLPVGKFLGWFPSAAGALLMAIIMSAVHFLIFLIMCAHYRTQVRELNELNERRMLRNQYKNIGGTV